MSRYDRLQLFAKLGMLQFCNMRVTGILGILVKLFRELEYFHQSIIGTLLEIIGTNKVMIGICKFKVEHFKLTFDLAK